MFKKVSLVIIILAVFIGAVGTLGFAWYSGELKPVSADQAKVRFVIERGSNASEIAKSLKEKDLIKSAFAFKLYTQLYGITDKIIAGEFTLSKNLSIPEIVQKFRDGPEEIWVTVPEGLRREQISEKFADSFGLNGQEAIDFRTEFLNLTEDEEGYLFPDTYLFPNDSLAAAVVNKLKSTFTQKTKDLEVTRQEVILASILERETLNPNEGPVVAGILLKRLEAGWPLQADATAQYVAGTKRCSPLSDDCDWWVNPTQADLAIVSPFNTYRQPGFPPAPIANPGLAMLTAAANPEESDYWYYLHDGEGQIRYAATLEEHNMNISRYLR